MTNELIQIKVKQRLNKLDSEDYDNIFCWQIQEAFNKAQRQFIRRQLEGFNQKREGREDSSQKIADLQQLLVTWENTFIDNKLYFESCSFPDDYLVFSRISANASSECCPDRRLTLYLAKESDVDVLLRDANKKPDYSWAETFYTLFGNKVRIYTDNKFDICNVKVIYYRHPRNIQFLNCTDTSTGQISTSDITCEFSDTLTEFIIDETVTILAGDLENQLQIQRNSQNEQRNT
jgi:hypothetical protein